MKLNNPKIYFDSCCFIDIVAFDAKVKTHDNRDYCVQCYKSLLRSAQSENIVVFTSFLSIVECTHIKNIQSKKVLTDEVKRLFDSIMLSGMGGVTLIMPSSKIIERARQLNWDYNITCKPYDQIHIASAIESNCSEFITTDIKSIDRDGNIERLKAFNIKIISVEKSQYLPADTIQTEIIF